MNDSGPVIGVVGPACAGKNEVAAFFEEKGLLHIDVDRVGHEVLQVEAARIEARFGRSALRGDGRVDRRRLGALVFSDPAALAALEAIVHPEMIRRAEEMVAGRPAAGAVINAALLYRMDLARLCRVVIEVRAGFLTRLARASSRDGLGILSALRRMRAQRGLRVKPQTGGADTLVVRNDGSIERLRARLEKIWNSGRY